ncbi:MAG: 16S rRNA (cytidine(1402)-2'-O)-methyltransferase [Rhizomicrobium sp.]
MSEPTLPDGEAQSRLSPALYVVATPIGHARDITLRALDVLRGCDAIAAEDTRATARLLAIHAISRPLLTYNDHNAPRIRPAILDRLSRGERIALVSDAGTPLVSDPGYKLLRDALAAGAKVEAIPGASASLAALVLSGLPTDRFLFAGFLPPRGAARRTTLEELKAVQASLVLFEAPHRLAETLRDMTEIFGARRAAVARELTKIHEEVRRDDLAALAKFYLSNAAPRGEITIVVGAPEPAPPDLRRADLLLDRALPFMPVRAAADLIAEALNIPRRAMYARALSRKRNGGDGA